MYDLDAPELGASEGPRVGYFAPHCDSSVLHAPGECETCDHFPYRQWLRTVERVNFSGHDDPDKAPCPSTFFRSAETRDQWPGNRASKVLDHPFMALTIHHHDFRNEGSPEGGVDGGFRHSEGVGIGHLHPEAETLTVGPAVYDDVCARENCGQATWRHHDWTGMYAKGGFVSIPTVILRGERGCDLVIPPTSRGIAILASALLRFRGGR